MPGYGDIGGSWRELNGGGYANIGGSWRQISEGYQNRGGVWEKVFPNYKDYGGDTTDILANGYIDKYGYWCRSVTASATHSGTEGQSYNGTRGATIDASYSGGTLNFFSTNEPFDGRGYNYLVFIYSTYITTDESSSGNRHNFQIYPIVSLSTSANVISTSGGRYLTGDNNSASKAYDTSYSACTFVDLTNVTSDDLYLLTGYYIGSSWNSNSYTAYGYVRTTSSYCTVMLYKNKSDCNISGSNYDYSWTLSF